VTTPNSRWWLLVGCLAPFVTPVLAVLVTVGIQGAL
jgi:hypothetical protein